MSKKMNLQQVKNGIYYSKAIYDFADSMSESCFTNLKLITQHILQQSYPSPVPSFIDCTLWEYFDKLERVFNYTANEWKSNVGRLLQFFHDVQGKREMAELYKSIFDLNLNLKVLLDGNDVYIDISSQPDESMDTSFDPQPDGAAQGPPVQISPFQSAPSQPKFDPKLCYPINRVGKRGLCLIVNMFRVGAGVDVIDGGEVFEKLNYEVMCLNNLTVEDYIKHQKKIREKIEELNSDSFIMIFSSHGDEENVLFIDKNLVPREEIMLRFLPSYCPCLAGKPKLFFFQNCRGTDLYQHTTQHDFNLLDPAPDDAIRYSLSATSKDIPKDILKFFATTEGHVAYRKESGSGSIFLQAFFEILRDDGHIKEDINAIQPVLATKVLEHSESGGQLPDCHSTLLKKFYFKHPDM